MYERVPAWRHISIHLQLCCVCPLCHALRYRGQKFASTISVGSSEAARTRVRDQTGERQGYTNGVKTPPTDRVEPSWWRHTSLHAVVDVLLKPARQKVLINEILIPRQKTIDTGQNINHDFHRRRLREVEFTKSAGHWKTWKENLWNRLTIPKWDKRTRKVPEQ